MIASSNLLGTVACYLLNLIDQKPFGALFAYLGFMFGLPYGISYVSNGLALALLLAAFLVHLKFRPILAREARDRSAVRSKEAQFVYKVLGISFNAGDVGGADSRSEEHAPLITVEWVGRSKEFVSSLVALVVGAWLAFGFGAALAALGLGSVMILGFSHVVEALGHRSRGAWP